jgi:membrane protein implicated in regulation of membrane protease activity
MERSHVGLACIFIGIISFVFSLFILLLQYDAYLVSLFIMFISVTLIAIGYAYAKGVDRSIDYSLDED